MKKVLRHEQHTRPLVVLGSLVVSRLSRRQQVRNSSAEKGVGPSAADE